METSRILKIYTSNSGYINRQLTKKYKHLIDEVKFYISSEWDVLDAINFVVNEEFSYLFIGKESDKNMLYKWMVNNIKKQPCL